MKTVSSMKKVVGTLYGSNKHQVTKFICKLTKQCENDRGMAPWRWQ